MRHRVAIKHLGRTVAHRKALRRNMAQSLFQHGAIRTTEVKAKELKGFVEKLITVARKGTLHARRQVLALLPDRIMVNAKGEQDDRTVVQKLFSELAPRYASRPGGYTRIIRLSERRIGDAGAQVLLQLVEEKTAQAAAEDKRPSRRQRRAARRREAAATQASAPTEQTSDAPPPAKQTGEAPPPAEGDPDKES